MLIILEGIDKAGKTTIINELKQLVEKKGIAEHFIFTAEPENNHVKASPEIRKMIMNNDYNFSNRTTALLFGAAREQHIADLINKYNDNKIIVCDRFVLSSLVYQSNNLNERNFIFNLNKLIIGDLKTDYTFFVNIDFSTWAKRISEFQKDKMEVENGYEAVQTLYDLEFKEPNNKNFIGNKITLYGNDKTINNASIILRTIQASKQYKKIISLI